MRKAFLAFCLAAFASLLALGGGSMMLGSRTAAWAKFGGGPTPQEYGGLKFTAKAANSSVKLTAVGSAPSVTLVKSFDGVNWSAYSIGDVIDLVHIGDAVYFAAGEGGNVNFGRGNSDYNNFVLDGDVAASGNIMSLLDFDMKSNDLPSASYCFTNLFNGCTSLSSAPNLPATVLAPYCYNYMFYGCTGLKAAPELPATSLNTRSYFFMFKGCSNLSYIKVHCTTLSASYSRDWVSGVASTGVFYKPKALPETYGTSNIPTGWEVVNID